MQIDIDVCLYYLMISFCQQIHIRGLMELEMVWDILRRHYHIVTHKVEQSVSYKVNLEINIKSANRGYVYTFARSWLVFYIPHCTNLKLKIEKWN